MDRNAGIGTTVFGIVLVIVGAIMRFAIPAHTSGFKIHEAGIILLLVGIGIVVLGLILLVLGQEPQHDADGHPGHSHRPTTDRAAGRLEQALTPRDVCEI
jgi:uncharacterized membrane protein